MNRIFVESGSRHSSTPTAPEACTGATPLRDRAYFVTHAVMKKMESQLYMPTCVFSVLQTQNHTLLNLNPKLEVSVCKD